MFSPIQDRKIFFFAKIVEVKPEELGCVTKLNLILCKKVPYNLSKPHGAF